MAVFRFQPSDLFFQLIHLFQLFRVGLVMLLHQIGVLLLLQINRALQFIHLA
ncbi:hypothetical protein D3C81_2274810 [compost metagenome]